VKPIIKTEGKITAIVCASDTVAGMPREEATAILFKAVKMGLLDIDFDGMTFQQIKDWVEGRTQA
jgi:hypothetical protein